MQPPDSTISTERSSSLWSSIRYGATLVWTVGRGHFIAMTATAIIAALLAPVTIVVMGIVVSELGKMVETGGIDASFDRWIIIVAAAAMLGTVLSSLQQYAKMRLKDSISLRIDNEILKHATHLDAATIDDRDSQDVIERARKNPGQAVLNLMGGLIQSAAGSVQLVTLGGVLVWVEPWWSLGLVAAVVPFFFASYWVAQIRQRNERLKTTQRRWTGYYSRLMTNRETSQSIKVLNLGKTMRDRFHAQMLELIADQRRISRIQVGLNLGTSLLLVGAVSGALWYAAHRAAAGELEIGHFAAFWMAVWKFRDAATKLGQSLSSIMDSRLAILYLNEFFGLRPALVDTGDLTPQIRGEIELKNVSFRYRPESKNVLEDVNLSIRPGEIVALVGPNGAGKSTLAKLIARLYAPSSGEVTIDGIPASDMKLDYYYRHVALVAQTAPRFEATARENIAFGDWEHLRDAPERVQQIAETAGADRVIAGLPEGYDTLLGRTFGTCDLSGGQWKKLSLARALAGDPRIVILDEPAANLDIQTERLVHRQLKQVLRGRTAILISHHFSSVLMADRIVVLVDGRVEEEGTHDELERAGGVYASMCRSHREMIGVRSEEDAGGETSRQEQKAA